MSKTIILITATLAFQLFTFNAVAQGSNTALEFDGNTDYVNFGDINSNTFDGVNKKLTVEAWVYRTNGGFQSIASKYNTTLAPIELTFSFAIRSTNKLQFVTYNNATGSTTGLGFLNAISTSTVPINKWTHVAIVIDLNSSLVEMYINGVQEIVTFSNVTPLPTVFDNNTVPVIIGTITTVTAGGLTNFFNGHIDEVRIWNKTLSQIEIQENMCNKLTGTEAGLVAYYPMNEGVDNTCSGGEDVCDRSGNGNHGIKF